MSAHDTTTDLAPNLRQPADELGPRAQHTIERILDATREVFLERGYRGTAVDEITARAGVSRASFYTYFASKRDALLALGSRATEAARAALEPLDHIRNSWSTKDLEPWLREVFSLLDVHGSVGFAWSEAAREDDELRAASMITHLRTCEILGARLNALRAAPLSDDTTLGLIVFGQIEQTWSRQRLYEDVVDRNGIVEATAAVIGSMLSPPAPPSEHTP